MKATKHDGIWEKYRGVGKKRIWEKGRGVFGKRIITT